MKVLKISANAWENSSRDKRELSVCRELGANVVVAAKGPVNGQRDEVDGFPVIRLSTRPLGQRVPVGLNRLASLFTWAADVRRIDADVITGHDLTGLLIGWLSNIGKRKKAKLVYDSHEFELGRNTQRSKLDLLLVCWLERFLMNRCAFSIMVNDSIADEVQRIHHLEERPVVSRNIPAYWTLDAAATAQVRRELLSQLSLPEDTFLALYHGVVTNNRGVENLLRAVATLPGTAAVVLGNGQPEYLDSLRHLSVELGIADRVLFHPAVPLEELRHYVSAANVGLVTVLPLYKSYYFMLPNKFFECIQSLTPVIVSDFPEVGRIVDQYGIGLKVDPADVSAIAAAIEQLRTDRSFYASCKANLQRAKEDLCWEKEKSRLKDAYEKIL